MPPVSPRALRFALPRRLLLLPLTVVVILGLGGPPPAAAAGLKKSTLGVPMSDGARLATDVYTPRGRGCWPAVLIRTPYSKSQIKTIMARFVCRKGYALVVQDMRGQGGGPRQTLVFLDDDVRHTDGHDTIRWIARQTWCDGRVGTWGPSAAGVVQNLSGAGAPSALKAQYISMAFSDMYQHAAYPGGAFRKSLVTGWIREYNLGNHLLEHIREHPTYDGQWESLNAERTAPQISAPAIYLGGWHDAFMQGALNQFAAVQNFGAEPARGHCRLIVGPWSHHDLDWLIRPRGQRAYPADGRPFDWFNTWLKCGGRGAYRAKPVHYYVMGASGACHGHFWRADETWPPPATVTPLYLRADRRLTADEPAADEPARRYTYNPNCPVPTLGGRNLNLAQGPRDQQCVERRGDVLTFTTAPLACPVEVTGRLLAKLHVSSNQPDTDFTVKLTDVYPDGRSMLIADGILRARYREGFTAPAWLEPGAVYPIDVDLWSTSYVFPPGHRIRVAVSSSNSPRFEPNPNTGPTGGDPVEATNTLHFAADAPSYIQLPVYGGGVMGFAE